MRRAALWALLWFGTRAAAAPLEVDFIDVGQGDATLITSPTGRTVLVDGGPPEGRAALLDFITKRAQQRPLDLVLLTHRHVDHLGGLERLIATVGARQFWEAPFPHRSPEYASLR